MKPLTKSQQKYLRKLAHQERPIFQMGKNGLTEPFLSQIDTALEKRELIKFTLLQNTLEDLKQVTGEIADEVGAYVVQTIGSTAVLYRPSSQEKYQRISREVTKQA